MDTVTKSWRLDGAETTLIFAWGDGVPALIYHGRRLPGATNLDQFTAIFERPLTQATLDVSEPVSLHPEGSRGFAGHPALIGSRSDAPRGWGGRFGDPKVLAIDQGVIFRMEDRQRELWLEIECRICCETDVATLRSRLGNDSTRPFVVDWLSVPAIAPDQRYSQSLTFHGRWCAEFDLHRADICNGSVLRENRRGRTSHDAFPGLVLLTEETGENAGSAIGAHLGWSGNHRLLLERLPTGDVQLQMGVLLLDREGVIEPGGVMETPTLYVAQSDDGLNAMSHKLHAHVRNHVLRFPDPSHPRPVTVNTWEAIYFDHRHEMLTSLADAAAEIGAERFVLDDGWFQGRKDDTTSLGDWYPDAEKYPDGLGPIADYVHDLGMQFGLWVEPEMVSPRSELYRRNPDWALGLRDYPTIQGRNQLLLDIARPEVRDYLFERIAECVGKHGVDYLKWDMNRDFASPEDESGNAAAQRQIEALYVLLDRLLDAFPKLEIESCASGGGRIDYGILERTHRFWVSDSNDAVERIRIQTGFSYFFPPELMGAHIGPAWSHTSGRGLHTGFRALVASYGHMGIEADLTKMSAADRKVVAEAVARFKRDRAIWHEGRFSRIRTVDPNLLGAIAITGDQRHARLILAQIDRPRATLPPRLPIHGLSPDQTYHVTLEVTSEMVESANRLFDNPLWQEGFVISGETLARAGIGLPSLYAQTGLAIRIDVVDKVG